MLEKILEKIIFHLNNNEILIVTVPNGYGCFEIQDFLWKKCKVGNILSFL